MPEAVSNGSATNIRQLLGPDADNLLKHESKTVSRSALHLPGPDFVDRVVAQSDRPSRSCATSRRS